jgi:vitamin B12 transporter
MKGLQVPKLLSLLWFFAMGGSPLFKYLLLGAVGSTALAGAAFASTQTANQVPITVSATRIATPENQVAAGVTVLTAQDFKERGEITLVDALQGVPGLNVVQSGGPGNVASVFIQGSNSEDVLVLLDGVPVNDPSTPNGAFNFGIYSLQDIARIEVVRGPMSGLYGSGAIGGVIDIITKRGTPQTHASLTAAGGWPAQGQGSASISGMIGHLDYALTAAINEQAGWDAVPPRMGSIRRNIQDPYRSRLGSLQLGYTFGDGTRIYAILRGQSTDSAFPDLGYPVFDDPNDYSYNDNFFSKFGLSTTKLNGHLHSDLFVSWQQNRLFNSNLLDANDPNQASAHDTYHGTRTDTQWNNNLRLPDHGAFTHSNILFGAEYTNDTADETVNETSYSYPFIETVHGSQHNWSGHLGVQTTIDNRLTLTGALRDDVVSSFGHAITWRAGAVLALPEIDADLKASVGTGFHAPSLFDLYYVDSYGDRGNPNLKPEYSAGWEIGPEFIIPAFGQSDFADVSANYFWSSVRGLIQSVELPDYTYTEENVSCAYLNGIETDFKFHPAFWLSAEFTYTYTRAVQGDNGPALLRRPQNTGSASATIRPVPRLTITPMVQYTGRFYDYIYNNSGYSTGTGSSAPGTVVNLNVSYRMNRHFTVFVTGRNILDSHFEASNGLQIPGASVLMGVRAQM